MPGTITVVATSMPRSTPAETTATVASKNRA